MSTKQNNSLQEYISAAIEHGKATLSGDYKTANKQYKILARISKKLATDKSAADEFFLALFPNPNISVRIWAASHALQLNIRTNEAEKILREISERKDIGIFRLDAEMTLKEWKKSSQN